MQERTDHHMTRENRTLLAIVLGVIVVALLTAYFMHSASTVVDHPATEAPAKLIVPAPTPMAPAAPAPAPSTNP